MTDDRRIHDDVAALVGDAADWFITRLEGAFAAGRTPHVALTGGSISDPFHAELFRRSADVDLPWQEVHWWWGDERFVAVDSPERNAGQALVSLLEPLRVPSDKIHMVPATDEATSVDAAADLYADELAPFLDDGFEVVLLGLGPDGHVASLFPGHESLEVTDRAVVAEHDSPKPPAQRVSLTFPVLNGARAVAFLATGEGKAEAVARALGEGSVAECPARGVRGREETVWFLDRAAAGTHEAS